MQNEWSNMKFRNKACHIKWPQSLNKSSKNWKDVYTAAGQITPIGMVKMWKKTRVVWVFLSDKEYSQKHPEAFTPHNPALFGPYNTQGGADMPQSFFLFCWRPGWSDLLKNGLKIKFLQKASIWDQLLVSQALSSREIRRFWPIQWSLDQTESCLTMKRFLTYFI